MATYEANQGNTSGKSGGGGGGGTDSNNRGRPRVCTYKEFMNCKPGSFYDNEGVVGLTHLIENMNQYSISASMLRNASLKLPPTHLWT